MTPSLERWQIKAKEAPSLHEVRLVRRTLAQYFNRNEDVSLNGYESDLAAIKCRVPRGSVPGLLLFSVSQYDKN